MRNFLILSIILLIPLALGNAYAYTITDDSTGGDCSTIGTWDSGSKTCTLSGDIDEGIVIGSNNIILDGDNHIVFGPGGNFENYGVLVEVRTNIVLKNIIVDNFYVGIQLNDSFNNIITDNTIQNIEHEGIVLSNFSKNNLISNNLVTGNGGHGIVSNSDNNEIKSNTSTQNEVGISSYANSGTKVIGNTVKFNSQGLNISSDSTLVEDNIVSDNTSRGILISGNSNTVKNNEISKTASVEFIVEEKPTHEFVFFCDSTIDNLKNHSEWKKYLVIMCECTGYPQISGTSESMYERGHTHLDDLLPIMLENIDKHWILLHASLAVKSEQLINFEKYLNKEYKLNITIINL